MPDPHAMPLQVSDLSVGYGDKLVLRGVNLRLQAGSIRAVIGGSGCGKSTLLRHIIGLLPARQGQVRLLGQPLAQLRGAARRRLLSQVGVLFQNSALLGNLSVLDNVALPLREAGGLPERLCVQVARMKLAALGLDHARSRPCQALSGGMQKRVALARALALDPPLLICDEPSAGLDPQTAAGLDALLLAQRETFGTAILLVTHELASITTLADHITLLANGTVVADQPAGVLVKSDEPHARAFFGRQVPKPSGSAQRLDQLLGAP